MFSYTNFKKGIFEFKFFKHLFFQQFKPGSGDTFSVFETKFKMVDQFFFGSLDDRFACDQKRKDAAAKAARDAANVKKPAQLMTEAPAADAPKKNKKPLKFFGSGAGSGGILKVKKDLDDDDPGGGPGSGGGGSGGGRGPGGRGPSDMEDDDGGADGDDDFGDGGDEGGDDEPVTSGRRSVGSGTPGEPRRDTQDPMPAPNTAGGGPHDVGPPELSEDNRPVPNPPGPETEDYYEGDQGKDARDNDEGMYDAANEEETERGDEVWEKRLQRQVEM